MVQLMALDSDHASRWQPNIEAASTAHCRAWLEQPVLWGQLWHKSETVSQP